MRYFKIKGHVPAESEKKVVGANPQIKQHHNKSLTKVQIGGVPQYNQMAVPEKAPVPKGNLPLMGGGSVSIKEIFTIKPNKKE